MILSDIDILKMIEKENIVYCDQDMDVELQLGPSSFDLRLSDEFIIHDSYNVKVIDPRKPNFNGYAKKIKIKEEGFIIHPKEFVLGSTLENVKIPDNMVGRLEGRSSYGRLGLLIHSTAGYIDPGFEGKITLEFYNVGKHPIILYPKERICQIAFEVISSYARVPYGRKKDNKYMNQNSVESSKIFNEMRK